MAKALSILVLTTIIITACKGHADNQSMPAKTDSISAALPQGQLRYWDSSISHNSFKGYIDTFSVSGTHFRVVHHDTLLDGIIEKLTNGEWQKNFEVDMIGMQQDYDYTKDVNADGFNDFVFKNNKHISSVYFYNPLTKAFLDTAVEGECCYWNWALLDTTKKVFYNSHEGVGNGHSDGYSNSILYTYNGLEKYSYYRLDIFSNKQTDSLEKIILYKCLNGNKNDTLKVRDVTDALDKNEQFDYSDFWKKNYKQLLGIQ